MNRKGQLQWYCFKNSCHIKGTSNTESTIFDAKDFLLEKEPETKTPLQIKDCAGWQSHITEKPKVWKYLEDNNCVQAYKAYPDKFWYDFPNDRVVFAEYGDMNSFTLATGRSLQGEKPKWYKYIALPGTYYVLNNVVDPDTVYIVEDCASACSLYRLGSTIALCGTTYDLYPLTQTIAKLGAKNIMVCLDKDAKITALRLRAELRSIGDFNTVGLGMLSNDAKYLTKEQLRKELAYA